MTSWIREIPQEEATGQLRMELDNAMQRAGRVWGIVQVMSVSPAILKDSIRLYMTIMYGASPLTRFQRELLATVVSAELSCRY